MKTLYLIFICSALFLRLPLNAQNINAVDCDSCFVLADELSFYTSYCSASPKWLELKAQLALEKEKMFKLKDEDQIALSKAELYNLTKKLQELSSDCFRQTTPSFYVLLSICKKPLQGGGYYWGISDFDYSTRQSNEEMELRIIPHYKIIEKEKQDRLELHLELIQNGDEEENIATKKATIYCPIEILTQNNDGQEQIAFRSRQTSPQFKAELAAAFNALAQSKEDDFIFYYHDENDAFSISSIEVVTNFLAILQEKFTYTIKAKGGKLFKYDFAE